jgi:hypothetical protein
MTKVSEVTVGSGGAASIEFTGIAGTGKDLLILVSARGAGANSSCAITFNSDTTSANYRNRQIEGNGASVDSTSASARPSATIPISTYTASTFGNASFYLSNYTVVSYKAMSLDSVSENNATAANQRINAGLWQNNNAITSVTLSNSSNFAEHSTASLYIIS